jgi:hypothetical protein
MAVKCSMYSTGMCLKHLKWMVVPFFDRLVFDIDAVRTASVNNSILTNHVATAPLDAKDAKLSKKRKLGRKKMRSLAAFGRRSSALQCFQIPIATRTASFACAGATTAVAAAASSSAGVGIFSRVSSARWASTARAASPLYLSSLLLLQKVSDNK